MPASYVTCGACKYCKKEYSCQKRLNAGHWDSVQMHLCNGFAAASVRAGDEAKKINKALPV